MPASLDHMRVFYVMFVELMIKQNTKCNDPTSKIDKNNTNWFPLVHFKSLLQHGKKTACHCQIMSRKEKIDAL